MQCRADQSQWWHVYRNVISYWYADSSVVPHPVSCPVESLDNFACDHRMFLWDEQYHLGIIVFYCRLQCKRNNICSVSEKIRHQLDSLARCVSQCLLASYSWPEDRGLLKNMGTARFLFLSHMSLHICFCILYNSLLATKTVHIIYILHSTMYIFIIYLNCLNWVTFYGRI